MIPISDASQRRRAFPLVNLFLIVANVAMFAYELSLGPALEEFLLAYGVIPAAISSGQALSPGSPSPVYLTLLTSQFLHGGFLHLAGNMVFLWVFGDNLEDYLGHLPYLLFYLASGVVAALGQVIADPASMIPAVGASGAIAGVLAGYAVLFPSASIRTLLFIGPFITMTRVSALLLIGFWFVLQLISAFLELSATTAASGGVAFFAHVGGFLFGLVIIWLWRGMRDTQSPAPA